MHGWGVDMIENDVGPILDLMAAIPALVVPSLGVPRQNKIDHNEALTDADILIDDYLSRELRRISSIPYISEETYSDVASQGFSPSEFWLVDPLDGTVNSIVGFPYYSASISHIVDNRVQSAYVINLASRDCFYAIRGSGLRKNGAVIQRPARTSRQIFCTGFAHDRRMHARQLKKMEYLLRHVDDFRRLASPCLDLCLVAEGVMSGTAEYLKAWDLAAGSLFLEESGVHHNHSGLFYADKLSDQFGFIAAEAWLFPTIAQALNDIE